MMKLLNIHKIPPTEIQQLIFIFFRCRVRKLQLGNFCMYKLLTNSSFVGNTHLKNKTHQSGLF
jgi:hypothetical protein